MADCMTMLLVTLKDVTLATQAIVNDSVISACIQAAETEHAARIQASAARQAGTMSLAAGVLALVAGALAFLAAGRQLMFEKSQITARTLAYKGRMLSALSELSRDLLLQFTIAEDTKKRLVEGGNPTIKIFPFKIDMEFNHTNWEITRYSVLKLLTMDNVYT